MPSAASAHPATPPARARRRLSVTSSLTMLHRLAPRARRTAISRSRDVARASRTLAAFAQARIRSSPTAASSTMSAGRTSPVISDSSEVTSALSPRIRGRVLRRQPSGEGLHLVARLLGAHSFSQARHHAHDVAVAVRGASCVHAHGNEDLLRARRERDARGGARPGGIEAGRRHPDDVIGLPIEQDRSPDHGRVEAEPALPEFEAQDHAR